MEHLVSFREHLAKTILINLWVKPQLRRRMSVLFPVQGTFSGIQGTFGIIQGTFGILQRTFGIVQGTFGILQGAFRDILGTFSIV